MGPRSEHRHSPLRMEAGDDQLVRDCRSSAVLEEPAAVPYAGINRIRFEGLLSGRAATPRRLFPFPASRLWRDKSSPEPVLSVFFRMRNP